MTEISIDWNKVKNVGIVKEFKNFKIVITLIYSKTNSGFNYLERYTYYSNDIGFYTFKTFEDSFSSEIRSFKNTFNISLHNIFLRKENLNIVFQDLGG